MALTELHSELKFKALSTKIMDNFDIIVKYFNLDLLENQTYYCGICTIHSGDNPTALAIFKNDDDIVFTWCCYTYNCHKTFCSGLFGLVRGLLSHKKYGWDKHGDKVATLSETYNFIIDLLGESDSDNLKLDDGYLEKQQFIRLANNFNPYEQSDIPVIDNITSSLDIPSQYYINRRYSKEILQTYGVGDCLDNDHSMRYRAVVPVYNNNKDIVGYTGRSIYELCKLCKMYHQSGSLCPQKQSIKMYGKWKHSFGLQTKFCLYNLWKAKKCILKTQTIILVESPGNVWRLEEAGIHNSVGLFGSSLSLQQQTLIDACGIFNVILILDNDKAGKYAQEKIIKQLNKTYRVFPIVISANDIGKMSIQQVQKEIFPQIEKIALTN